MYEKEQLNEISNDEILCVHFKTLTCQKFWLLTGKEYAYLKIKVINILMQFVSTYICENFQN